jgi:hypothetical protein
MPLRLGVALALLALSCAGVDGVPATARDGGADDGGTTEDGGQGVDAGATLDGGIPSDGGAPADGGLAADGGETMDSGAPADGGTASDGGATADGGLTQDGGGAIADGGASPDGGAGTDGGAAGDGGTGTCRSSRDCSEGRVCSGLSGGGTSVVATCVIPRASPPAQPVGGACSSDGDCREDLCLDGITGECSVVCADSALDCPASFACTAYYVDQTAIGFCVRGCTRDADCMGGNTCTFNSNELQNTVDRVCQRPAGVGALGAACASGADCRSSVCLFTTIFTGTACTTQADCTAGETCECPQPGCAPSEMRCIQRFAECTALCGSHSDCAAPLTDCTGIEIDLPAGTGTTLIPMCTRP